MMMERKKREVKELSQHEENVRQNNEMQNMNGTSVEERNVAYSEEMSQEVAEGTRHVDLERLRQSQQNEEPKKKEQQ